MLPTKSFCLAMAVAANNGKAWGENWNPKEQYIEKVENKDGLFLRLVKNGVEKIGWSPSLADLSMGWEFKGKISKDTFGYALLKLIDEKASLIRHEDWSEEIELTIEDFTIENNHDEEVSEDGIIIVTDVKKIEENLVITLPNGEITKYFPTIPDILRKGWIIE